ncbi:dinitrogenase iron-molybdenum cofactor [Candidatus Vecturithrix granuli]|uniref:Dinitrogenase iron-molybdenum cofactor n=1 Tax=Vecturithrix granuli TaxID=1499967 RepID=A0A081BWX9_VECG1|nr:dinitrogenase iron-molybdenum cofactor [Candidatus Vecturithrix granuli]
MKIAISAQGNDLQAAIEPRFGRCQQFVIVETETMECEVLENPNIAASGGAGIQTAQLLAQKGVQAVLTGNCGPNAFATLQAAGIQVLTNVTGTVQTAVEQYKNGQLQAAAQPNVGGHFGDPRSGGGRGMGQGGMGGGRGQGRGRR